MILKEDTQSDDWILAKVIEVYKDNKGYVQMFISEQQGRSDPARLISLVLVHLTDKIVLLVDSDEVVRSLTEELL